LLSATNSFELLKTAAFQTGNLLIESKKIIFDCPNENNAEQQIRKEIITFLIIENYYINANKFLLKMSFHAYFYKNYLTDFTQE
jgi:hypothetical protein